MSLLPELQNLPISQLASRRLLVRDAERDTAEIAVAATLTVATPKAFGVDPTGSPQRVRPVADRMAVPVVVRRAESMAAEPRLCCIARRSGRSTLLGDPPISDL